MLQVNPTRMELLRLKKRLVLARRGHKLLKDKQDELMRQLGELVETIKSLREKVEEEVSAAIRKFLFVRAVMEPERMECALMVPGRRVKIGVKERNVMSVKVPLFEKEVEGEGYGYTPTEAPPEMDAVVDILDAVIEDVIELAEKEKMLQLLADEIEKTRRRVNALEYVLIPELEETIRYISMKMSEMERADLTRLMKMKDIIRGEKGM